MVVALIAAGFVLAIVSVVVSQRDNTDISYTVFPLISGILIVGAGLFVWIRMGIKRFYKKWAKEHNEELYQQEITKKNNELQQYKDMYETVRAANHGMTHRQAAVERRVAGILERIGELALPAEFGAELALALEDIRGLSREYQEKVGRIKADRKLPSTNIQALDDIFGLFAERFAGGGIDFTLRVSGSVIHMVENVIPRDRLETLIGDHLQDALIAVGVSENPSRNVLAIIGEAGDCYEFSVHDSGIPFEEDTLARLGTERVTTHAADGGSGIGFVTTFETLRACGASLIIRENKPGGAFTKSVAIRFDGRKQYIVRRADGSRQAADI